MWPQFFVQSYILPTALLARTNEADLRAAYLLVKILCSPADVIWQLGHPQLLSKGSLVAAALIASAAWTLLGAAAAGVVKLEWRVCLAANVAANFLMIPLAQMGSYACLARGQSPAPFKMTTRFLATLSSTFLFLFPEQGTRPAVVVLLLALPTFFVALALLFGELKTVEGAAKKAINGMVSASDGRSFLLAGLCVGTMGEAINDMATELQVRASLQSSTDLALTNNISILIVICVAMGLWLPSGKNSGMKIVFSVGWFLCQSCRAPILYWMYSRRSVDALPAMGHALFALSAIMDKLFGALGTGAFDTALLKFLNTRHSPSGRVRCSSLWVVRQAWERMERPLVQLLALSFPSALVFLIVFAPCAAAMNAVFTTRVLAESPKEAPNADEVRRPSTGRPHAD